MKEELIKLNGFREKMEKLKVQKQAANDKFLLDNESLFNEINNLDEQMNQTSELIKKTALDKYADNGEKNLDFGVKIRVLKKLEYNDDEALKWAKDHGLALNLDVASFKKIAQADPMDFVSIIEVPQATIPFKIEVEK